MTILRNAPRLRPPPNGPHRLLRRALGEFRRAGVGVTPHFVDRLRERRFGAPILRSPAGFIDALRRARRTWVGGGRRWPAALVDDHPIVYRRAGPRVVLMGILGPASVGYEDDDALDQTESAGAQAGMQDELKGAAAARRPTASGRASKQPPAPPQKLRHLSVAASGPGQSGGGGSGGKPPWDAATLGSILQSLAALKFAKEPHADAVIVSNEYAKGICSRSWSGSSSESVRCTWTLAPGVTIQGRPNARKASCTFTRSGPNQPYRPSGVRFS